MKRKLSLVLAVAVLVCMVFAVPTFADITPAGKTVTVTTEVSEPVWNIVVPTTMPMALDPFALNDGASQVYSPDFTVVNKSQVAVKATATVTLSGAAVFKDNAAAVTETNTDKLALVQAKVANSVNVTTKAGTFTTVAALGGEYFLDSLNVANAATFTTDSAVDVDKVEGVYNASSPAVNLGTAATKVEFALQKADYMKYYTTSTKSAVAYEYRNMAADKKGVASWRFVGKLNSYAAWQASDITATVAYSFAGLTPENYAAAVLEDGGHQYISKSLAPSIETTSYTTANNTPVVVAMSFGEGMRAATGVASVKVGDAALNQVFYEISGTNITFKANYINAIREDGTNVAITITFNDSANTAVVVTLNV